MVNAPETIEDAGGRVHWIERPDGVRLRAATFGDPSAEAGSEAHAPRGWAGLLLGYTEFIEKHLETVCEMRQRGFAVVVHDWRGQGLSTRQTPDRHKGHLEDFTEHRDDLFAIWEAVGVLRAPNSPPAPGPAPDPAPDPAPVVFAFSMGGHVALLAEAERPGLLGPSVLFAAMLGVDLGGMPERLARVLVRMFCRIGMSKSYVLGGAGYDPDRRKFEGNKLTHDAERFARWHRLIAVNPDLAIGEPTMGWVRAAFRSILLTRRPGWLERIRTPILLISAGHEHIVDNAAIARAAQRLPNAETLAAPAAKHELMSELDPVREELWKAIDGFLERQGR